MTKTSTENQAQYYEKHREAWNEYQKLYKRRKYAEDPEYRERVKAYQKARYAKNKAKKNKNQSHEV